LFHARQAKVRDPEFDSVAITLRVMDLRCFISRSEMTTLDQQVRRLDVAVQDAVLVGVVEGFGGLDAELGDGAEVVFAAEVGERREVRNRFGVDLVLDVRCWMLDD
jgi:hypothetical protein